VLGILTRQSHEVSDVEREEAASSGGGLKELRPIRGILG
jgi:hypothetical protein